AVGVAVPLLLLMHLEPRTRRSAARCAPADVAHRRAGAAAHPVAGDGAGERGAGVTHEREGDGEAHVVALDPPVAHGQVAELALYRPREAILGGLQAHGSRQGTLLAHDLGVPVARRGCRRALGCTGPATAGAGTATRGCAGGAPALQRTFHEGIDHA